MLLIFNYLRIIGNVGRYLRLVIHCYIRINLDESLADDVYLVSMISCFENLLLIVIARRYDITGQEFDQLLGQILEKRHSVTQKSVDVFKFAELLLSQFLRISQLLSQPHDLLPSLFIFPYLPRLMKDDL